MARTDPSAVSFPSRPRCGWRSLGTRRSVGGGECDETLQHGRGRSDPGVYPSSSARSDPFALSAENASGSKPSGSQSRASSRSGRRGGILALDILFTGLLGVVVDAATSGWWDLSPNDVTLVLERRDASLDGPDEVRVDLNLDEEGGAAR